MSVFLKSGEQLADGEKHARAEKKNTNSVEKNGHNKTSLMQHPKHSNQTSQTERLKSQSDTTKVATGKEAMLAVLKQPISLCFLVGVTIIFRTNPGKPFHMT